MRSTFASLLCLALLAGCSSTKQVGERIDGSSVVPTGQLIRSAGKTLLVDGRPVSMIAFNGKLIVKDNRGLLLIDPETQKVEHQLAIPGGTSLTGLVVGPDGSIWASNAGSSIHRFSIEGGKFVAKGKIDLPEAAVKGAAYPCGLVFADRMLVAAVSRSNALAVIDPGTMKVQKLIPVDVCPYDVVAMPDGDAVWVSCWGGPAAKPGERQQESSGTPVRTDVRGVARSATVLRVEIESGTISKRLPVGLQPTDLELNRNADTLFCANANDDSVSIIDVGAGKERLRLDVKPDRGLLFGSMPNALTLSPDEKTLYVANGGNNSVAVVSLGAQPKVAGFIPVGWYPTGLFAEAERLFVANAKGIGSRARRPDKSYGVYGFTGSISFVPLPNRAGLVAMTKQAREDGLIPEELRAQERRMRTNTKPVPVPKELGEPSSIEHVVYILKENRTYDQVFGAIGRGDGEPKLCIFGRDVSPNHHAIADQFVLLDNFYCNGVLSADGHAWSMEGNATTYFERSFGGWTRSYPFGDDPLAVSASGFLWDHVLAAGLSFKNYGEFNYTEPKPGVKWKQIYDDWKAGKKSEFTHKIGVERLRGYTHMASPGWNMSIPEQVRADEFIADLKTWKSAPNLTIIYLPQDHGSGTTPGEPTPRACMADNDLALGRILDALSKSKWWKKMAVFVTEDDPQNGFDHVDGHRTIALVAGPHVKRGGKVVSQFYNQTSILHTICRILGLRPLNQMVAMSPLMSECFTDKPDFTAFDHLPNRIPLDELNPPRSALNAQQRKWADLSLKQNFRDVDAADEDDLNRIIWHSVKGVETPYPAEWAGAHGRGLKGRGLKPDQNAVEDEEEEERR